MNQDITIGPTANFTFLALEIGTLEMQVKIFANKVQELKLLLQYKVTKKKIRLSQLEVLVGKLNFLVKLFQEIVHLIDGWFTTPCLGHAYPITMLEKQNLYSKTCLHGSNF